jgi:hypothetical protein
MSGPVTPPPQLTCQSDSYVRECEGIVRCCRPLATPSTGKREGKSKKGEGEGGREGGREVVWVVEMEDSCLFPEGGGQPTDYGWIIVGETSHHVTHVVRNPESGLISHHISSFIPEGTAVKTVVDWERRIDHMIQHTAVTCLSPPYSPPLLFLSLLFLSLSLFLSSPPLSPQLSLVFLTHISFLSATFTVRFGRGDV